MNVDIARSLILSRIAGLSAKQTKCAAPWQSFNLSKFANWICLKLVVFVPAAVRSPDFLCLGLKTSHLCWFPIAPCCQLYYIVGCPKFPPKIAILLVKYKIFGKKAILPLWDSYLFTVYGGQGSRERFIKIDYNLEEKYKRDKDVRTSPCHHLLSFR